MGPKVEDAVLANYDSSSGFARQRLIEILGTVATEKGIAKLREIAADKSDRNAAAKAQLMLLGRGVNVRN